MPASWGISNVPKYGSYIPLVENMGPALLVTLCERVGKWVSEVEIDV